MVQSEKLVGGEWFFEPVETEVTPQTCRFYLRGGYCIIAALPGESSSWEDTKKGAASKDRPFSSYYNGNDKVQKFVIPAKAGHAVKPWSYPVAFWMPDRVRHDVAVPFSAFFQKSANLFEIKAWEKFDRRHISDIPRITPILENQVERNADIGQHGRFW